MNESDKAFEKMARDYEQTIYSICYMYANNKTEAQDLLQEVLINLWKGFQRFRGDSNIRTWIIRVTLNTCISFKRKKKLPTVDESFIPDFSNPTPDVGKQVAMLHTRLQKLDYLDRAVVLLWLEDLPYDEIGAIVGMPVKNVGVRLVRIKEKLKEMSTTD